MVDEPRRAALAVQGRVVLAIDGLQPDVGHEVLWVVRDCLSGQVLLARPLLSAAAADLAGLPREVTAAIGVPVAGVVSDGQHSVRLAVGQALPGVPHQLCQFHYLREAGLPIFEADRHAKKNLGSGSRRAADRARGRGPRRPRGRGGARLLRGRPLGAHRRWPAAAGGLRTEAAPAPGGGRRQPGAGRGKGGLSKPLQRIAALIRRGLERTAALWPDVRRAYRWLRAAASILANRAKLDATGVQARYERLLAAWPEFAVRGHISTCEVASAP